MGETDSDAKRRILVCGGRDYHDAEYMSLVLNAAKPAVIIHGAAKGADTLAGQWARDHGVPVEEYPANWDRDGLQAGPLRNLRMLTESKPDLVIAFPGGKGTAHMRKVARAHGVQIVNVQWESP